MKKTLAITAVCLLAAGLVFLNLESGDGEAHPEIGFKTIRVRQGPMQVEISATGVVEPNFQVEVKSKASGRVLSFPFEEGDRVRKGQLLLQLDKSAELRSVARANADLQSATAKLKKSENALLLQKSRYKTGLRSAESEVEAAQVSLKEAEDKRRRQVDLFDQQVAARETLDAAKTAFLVSQETLEQARARLEAARQAVHDIALKENEVELARAEVKRSQIALDEAKEKLDETEIFAPISGVITEKLVEEGQIISSGISNVSGGTPLCKIADLSRLFITADVDETDIGTVRRNQRVSITTDAYPGKKFPGEVKRIAPQGQVESNITVFKVKIEVLGEGKENLRPMMSANVDIITELRKNVMFLPREAIWQEDEQFYAGTVEDGLPKKIRITPGIKNLTQVEVLDGLQANQEVLLDDWKKIQARLDEKKGKMSTVSKILFLIRAK